VTAALTTQHKPEMVLWNCRTCNETFYSNKEKKGNCPECPTKKPSNYVTPSEHKKRLIATYQKEITDLKRQKHQEAKNNLSNGRRKWFNTEIQRLRKEINKIRGVN